MSNFNKSFELTKTFPKLSIIAIASALCMTGCANFTDIAPSATQIVQINVDTPNGLGSIKQTSDAWPNDNWWFAYNDPQLNELIAHALSHSPNLALAQTRIARAQAALDASKAAIGVQKSIDADANYGRQSENYIIPKPPLGVGGTYVSQGKAVIDFSYDLDLWGKNSALITAAAAQANAVKFDNDAAKLALTTSIVRSYAHLAAQYEMQDVLLAMQKQRDSMRMLAQQRLTSGLDTRVEVKQSETSIAALHVELIQLDTAIAITRLQLAVLTGDMPSAAKNIARPKLTNTPFTVPNSLPIDLLSRRPELAAQRARIDAAMGEVQSAKAQFYPNISLTGFAGFQSIGLDKLLNTGSFVNNIGPAIHLPIFNQGGLQANFAGKTADIDAAINQYNQSVLGAVQDVAEQLTRIAALAREEEASNDALAASEEAYRLAMLRYRGNLSPYLTALTVETQLLMQKRAAADLRAKHQDLQIALVRALGGGFNDRANPVVTDDFTSITKK